MFMLLKSLLALTTLAAAAASSAITLDLNVSSEGWVDLYSTDPVEVIRSGENILSQDTDGFSKLISGDFAYVRGMPQETKMTYVSANGSQLVLDLTVTSYVKGNQFTSLSGTWKYSPGSTRSYSGFNSARSSGEWQFVWDRIANVSDTGVQGHLSSAPEPASMAALGLGAVALFRRRHCKIQ